MTDTYARVRQIVGTTADWAANNIVLGSGEIGIERVSSSDIRIKVGDGTTAWASLPYASASSTTINSATQAALDAKLAKSGGTMTGLLVLSGDAVAALGAVTKQQLDAINTALSTSISGKLSTSGGALTGSLTLASDPTSALHAATKQYVDAASNSKLSKSGDTMSGALTLSADPTSALHAATKQYVDGGAYQTSVGGSATYAGKVVRTNGAGVIDSSLVPVSATYLGTVNVTVAYALTGSYTAGDYFAVSVSGTVDSSWNAKINGSPSTAGAGQFLIFNANGKFDLVGDTSSSSAISGKLDKSGGTMTGALVLAADPTVALGAATRQYADTMLPKAGGTMTGALMLSTDPTAPLYAATKQYVDNSISNSIATAVLKAGGTMTGLLTLSGVPTASLHAATKAYADAGDAAVTSAYQAADTALTAAYQAADGNRVNKAGDAMTGLLTLSADPTSALHAATKQYADTKAPLASPALTGTPTAPSAARYATGTQIATVQQVYDSVTNVPMNWQNVATYTLASTDKGKMVQLEYGTGVTVTVPSGVFSAGDRVDLTRLSGGAVTLIAGAGMTIYSKDSKLSLNGNYSAATLHFWDSARAQLIGDLA